MASLAPGYRRFTAWAITWLAVWRRADRPFSSRAVRIFNWQSSSTTVRKSAVSPLISPAQAARASPSLISRAISYTDLLSAYSLTEPSFNVTFMAYILSFLAFLAFPAYFPFYLFFLIDPVLCLHLKLLSLKIKCSRRRLQAAIYPWGLHIKNPLLPLATEGDDYTKSRFHPVCFSFLKPLIGR